MKHGISAPTFILMPSPIIKLRAKNRWQILYLSNIYSENLRVKNNKNAGVRRALRVRVRLRTQARLEADPAVLRGERL